MVSAIKKKDDVKPYVKKLARVAGAKGYITLHRKKDYKMTDIKSVPEGQCNWSGGS